MRKRAHHNDIIIVLLAVMTLNNIIKNTFAALGVLAGEDGAENACLQ